MECIPKSPNVNYLWSYTDSTSPVLLFNDTSDFIASDASSDLLSYISIVTDRVRGTLVEIEDFDPSQVTLDTTPSTSTETPLQAVQDCDDRFGQSWYGLTVINATDDQVVDVAKYIESSTNKHLFGVTTQDTSTLAGDPNSATIASQLKALNLKRTFVQYSSSSPYAVCSAFGRLLTTDYNANNSVITLMYKNEPTVTAEYLTSTQITNLEAKNCNVFVAYNNGTAIIEPGVVSSGDFVDTISNVDWLATQIQTSVYNLLYTSKTKIPQTDSGNHLIASVISSVCAQAQTNGICAPGVWTSNGFGGLKYNDFMPTGYYVYAPPISSQLLADRNARKSVSFQVALKLAGAIHSVKISVNVNH